LLNLHPLFLSCQRLLGFPLLARRQRQPLRARKSALRSNSSSIQFHSSIRSKQPLINALDFIAGLLRPSLSPITETDLHFKRSLQQIVQKHLIFSQSHLPPSRRHVQQKRLHAFDVWRVLTLKRLAQFVAGRDDPGSS
jgi:hypothetical protein